MNYFAYNGTICLLSKRFNITLCLPAFLHHTILKWSGKLFHNYCAQKGKTPVGQIWKWEMLVIQKRRKKHFLNLIKRMENDDKHVYSFLFVSKQDDSSKNIPSLCHIFFSAMDLVAYYANSSLKRFVNERKCRITRSNQFITVKKKSRKKN